MTSARFTVDTNEGNGKLFVVATQSSTAPNAFQVEGGVDENNDPADWTNAPLGQTVSATGTQTIDTEESPGLQGGIDAPTYYAHFMQKDAAGNRSAVVTSPGFVLLGDEGVLSAAGLATVLLVGEAAVFVDFVRLSQQYAEVIHSGENNLIRLSQQYGEVIHSGEDNIVRLSQQYVEVIHEFIGLEDQEGVFSAAGIGSVSAVGQNSSGVLSSAGTGSVSAVGEAVGSGDWLLSGGEWNDAGQWDDSAQWED